MARAIATRCRCPPDSFTPRSPTTVSYFFSNSSMNSSACAIRLTSRICVRRRLRAAVADVVADRCRRTGSCPAARRRAASGSRAAAPSSDRGRRSAPRPDSGRLNAITRLMSVLLPDPLEPTSAVVVPGRRAEADVLQHRHAGVVLEADVVELDLALEHAERRAAGDRRRPRSASASARGCDRARRTLR